MRNTIAAKIKQRGFAFTPELLVVSTALTAGIAAGTITLRDATLAETEDVAESIGSLNQSYSFPGLRSGNGSASVGGSGFRDAIDRGAGDGVRMVLPETTYSEGQ